MSSPVVQEAEWAAGMPWRSSVVETSCETCGAAVSGGRACGITGTMAVEEMEASYSTTSRRLRACMDAKRAGLDREPRGKVSEMGENVKLGIV